MYVVELGKSAHDDHKSFRQQLYTTEVFRTDEDSFSSLASSIQCALTLARFFFRLFSGVSSTVSECCEKIQSSSDSIPGSEW